MSRAIQEAQLVLGFSMDDLEANRKGKITEFQKTRLRQRFWRKFFWSNVIPISVGVLLVLFALGTFMQGAPVGNALFILLAAAFIAVCLGGVALIDWSPYRKDFREGKILQGKGKAQVDELSSRIRQIYSFQGEDVNLVISRQEFNAFLAGKSYIVYYLPNTKAILSAEDR